MHVSARWLNSLLSPGNLQAAEMEHALTFAGFPVESIMPVEAGGEADSRLDVELTSNRGDCLSHIGLARELAAVTGRALQLPQTPDLASHPVGGESASETLKLNLDPNAGCPRFSLLLIRGVRVGPSPAWLRTALEAAGHRSINNIVDVTNYVLLEQGVPSHAFDAGALAADASGSIAIAVRPALKGETLKLLDGRSITLAGSEIVIADSAGPRSLAGIMGGESSAVTDRTQNIALEVATWSPTAVRMAARRHNLRTDASHRYERTVPAAMLDGAQARLAQLILQVAGGTLAPGTVVAEQAVAGQLASPPRTITLRTHRLAQVVGTSITADCCAGALIAQGFTLAARTESHADGSETLTVAAPNFRTDVNLEIDLIEEVIRTLGYDHIPSPERIGVTVRAKPGREAASAELCRVLTGLGLFETVSFSFTSAKKAKPFVPAGLQSPKVSEERRGIENVLRPSAICGLLDVRRTNQDGKVSQSGGVRLFELASAFTEHTGEKGAAPTSRERATLCLLIDVPEVASRSGYATGLIERRQAGVSQLRGVLEAVVLATLGPEAKLHISPTASDAEHQALDASASGIVMLSSAGAPAVAAGYLGIISEATQRLYELERPVVVAEIDADMLLSHWPPKATARELPVYPATDRDLSLIVSERTQWQNIVDAIEAQRPANMESLRFITTYRGKPLTEGSKSVTMRMTFRDAARTLTDELVTPEVEKLTQHLCQTLQASVRTA